MNASLENMVDDYINIKMQEDINYVKLYETKSKELNYSDYVDYAVVFCPDHMWIIESFRLKNALKSAALYIKANENKINSCKCFDEIIYFLNMAEIKNFDELSQYDKALAMGIYLNLMPEKVFMHAGPRSALKYILGTEYNLKIETLKGTNKIEYINICDLPFEFQQFKGNIYLVDNCLCYIYSRLKKNKMIK
ncbi:MAG TPA: hypothetical protein VIM70_11625 [Clostridium sp.]|uniref:hypothetical protein n=1 Tax=Clostridium sp. TaxID=1506 RepID=UPI002F91F2CD